MPPNPIRMDSALHGLWHLSHTEPMFAQPTLEAVVGQIAPVVDFDGVFAGATDPETGFCLGAGLVCNVDERVCHPIWEHEFLIPDVNKFADLTSANPVGDLRDSTDGRPTRSPRFRMMQAITGLEEELRVTFHSGGRSWGILQLGRFGGEPPFNAEDRAFLRRAAPLAGHALRRSLLQTPVAVSEDDGPGVVVLDDSGAIVSATAAAHRWLPLLVASWPVQPGTEIPPALALGALSTLNGSGARSWRTRLRTSEGIWLTACASALRDSRQVALTLAPAKASEVAPLVMRAYGLTDREIEVTHSVARGLATAEIAATLSVSAHTVRDHLKAIFEKVGVSSRGELNSRLFADHYHPRYDQAVAESFARIPELLTSARHSEEPERSPT